MIPRARAPAAGVSQGPEAGENGKGEGLTATMGTGRPGWRCASPRNSLPASGLPRAPPAGLPEQRERRR